MNTSAPPRLVFVHAHPDDETIATGVAIAGHALAGHEVTVLTATLGDEGEVIPAELRHLAVEHEDRLGPYRRTELASALARLGVRGVVLGDPPNPPDGEHGALYRDSGMAGTDANERTGALCVADTDEVLDRLVATLDHLDPDVVVTYDATGGYGHPDHVRVHELTVAATARMARVPALYAVVVPRSWAEQGRTWVREHVQGEFIVLEEADPYPPSVVDDSVVTHVVEGTPGALVLRDSALAEHRTQVSVHDGFYTLSNNIAARLAQAEAFVRLEPGTGAVLSVPHRVVGLLTEQDAHA